MEARAQRGLRMGSTAFYATFSISFPSSQRYCLWGDAHLRQSGGLKGFSDHAHDKDKHRIRGTPMLHRDNYFRVTRGLVQRLRMTWIPEDMSYMAAMLR